MEWGFSFSFFLFWVCSFGGCNSEMIALLSKIWNQIRKKPFPFFLFHIGTYQSNYHPIDAASCIHLLNNPLDNHLVVYYYPLNNDLQWPWLNGLNLIFHAESCQILFLKLRGLYIFVSETSIILHIYLICLILFFWCMK
jgi:hypothetical protein